MEFHRKNVFTFLGIFRAFIFQKLFSQDQLQRPLKRIVPTFQSDRNSVVKAETA